jgi:hypothetical protein
MCQPYVTGLTGQDRDLDFVHGWLVLGVWDNAIKQLSRLDKVCVKLKQLCLRQKLRESMGARINAKRKFYRLKVAFPRLPILTLGIILLAPTDDGTNGIGC